MNAHINRSMWFIAVLSGGLMLPLSAQAASFDCAKAGTKVEHIICDNAEISKLDDDLSTAYKAALQDQAQADAIKQAQKQWMKERNGCADAGCVKHAYEARLSSLVAKQTNSGDGVGAKTEVVTPPASQVKTNNGYELLVGKGVEVCEEYKKNLNSFPPNPLWRKINPALKEFSKPEWSSMSMGEKILFKVDDFVWQRDANPAYYVNKTFWRGTKEEYIKARKAFEEDSSRVYWNRDASKIDINNDGVPENVVAANFGRGGLLLLVVNDDLSDIDYAKTKLVMQHPSRKELGILRPYAPDEWKLPLKEWKLPSSMESQENTIVKDSLNAAYYGVFSFKGKNYFDLWWEDPIIEGKGGQISGLNYQTSRLRVFFAEKNDVKEICNYRLVK